MTLYKLTTQDWYTRKGEYNETKWGPGVSHSGTGKGDLCGPGWIHAYTSPLLAVLLNPIHAGIKNPVLWEARGNVEKSDNGLKVGCKTLTTVRIVDIPEITVNQRVAFAILCAKAICTNKAWLEWANNWLSNKNRTADAAYDAAAGAAGASAYAAAASTADAAYAAARAAYAAYDAAAYAADAAYAAARAAYASLDIIEIAEKAMEIK